MTAFVVAGTLSALGAGSYLTLSATADERPARFDAVANTPNATINVDSLYAAKADEATTLDTAFVAPLAPERTISGRVSWYGPGFHGRKTANGERFDKNEMTAAHKTLPFGTLVKVTDEANGRSVLVRVNDRGPYCGNRVLDLSEAAARRLGIIGRGTASARIEVYSSPKSKSETATVSFDRNGAAIRAHGYTVKLASFDSFDEAIAMQHRLEQDGRENVYLTQTRENGKLRYSVSLGLFSSEHLCATLLADVADSFSKAEITAFSAIAGTPSGEARVADTIANDRADL